MILLQGGRHQGLSIGYREVEADAGGEWPGRASW
jgi:hypothetical protein